MHASRKRHQGAVAAGSVATFWRPRKYWVDSTSEREGVASGSQLRHGADNPRTSAWRRRSSTSSVVDQPKARSVNATRQRHVTIAPILKATPNHWEPSSSDHFCTSP
jgi:hypothetical protein